MVEAGVLKREQVTPRAPWEVSRRDLDAEPIRSVIERLHRTGKLVLQGGCAEDQLALFTENQGDVSGLLPLSPASWCNPADSSQTESRRWGGLCH